MSRRRRVLLCAGLLLLSLGLGGLVSWRSYARRLAEIEARWPEEVRAARARAARVRVPALRGEAIDEDAVDRYRHIFTRFRARDLFVTDPITGDPRRPLPPRLIEVVVAVADDLEALREALRCARCDWQTPYELPSVARDHLGTTAHELGRLLVAAGHARAQGGDVVGAAAMYLDAARLGADVGRGDGFSVAPTALEALSRLIASDQSSALPLGQVEEQLDRLEAAFAPLPDLLAEARLDLTGRLLRARATGDVEAELLVSLDGPWRYVPRRPLLAHALGELDEAWRRAERDLASADVEGWARDQEAIHEWGWGERVSRRLPSSNPLVLQLYPDPASWFDARCQVLTWLAFARTAIALERLPAPRDPSRVTLPIDPARPRTTIRLEVAPDGSGYRLSSPGPTRFHCGAQEKREVVLERRRP